MTVTVVGTMVVVVIVCFACQSLIGRPKHRPVHTDVTVVVVPDTTVEITVSVVLLIARQTIRDLKRVLLIYNLPVVVVTTVANTVVAYPVFTEEVMPTDMADEGGEDDKEEEEDELDDEIEERALLGATPAPAGATYAVFASPPGTLGA